MYLPHFDFFHWHIEVPSNYQVIGFSGKVNSVARNRLAQGSFAQGQKTAMGLEILFNDLKSCRENSNRGISQFTHAITKKEISDDEFS